MDMHVHQGVKNSSHPMYIPSEAESNKLSSCKHISSSWSILCGIFHIFLCILCFLFVIYLFKMAFKYSAEFLSIVPKQVKQKGCDVPHGENTCLSKLHSAGR